MPPQCARLHHVAALNWDCGMWSVEYRVIQKKLLFIHYLVHLDEENLAKEIFCTQKEFSLPGFVKEGRDLLNYFNLPTIVYNGIAVSKLQWKKWYRKPSSQNLKQIYKLK